MRSTDWIMAAGVAFGLGYFLVAVIDADPWEDPVYDRVPPILAGAASPHGDGRDQMACSSCHEILPNGPGPAHPWSLPRVWGPPLAVGTPSPHRDGRERQDCAQCHPILTRSPAPPTAVLGAQVRTVALTGPVPPLVPASGSPALDPEWHERFARVRFQGTVAQIIDPRPGSGLTTVHMLVSDGIHPPLWASLAPRDYLNSQGCPLSRGVFVKGTAFQEAGRSRDGLLYVWSMSLNGQFCLLRDSHMRNAWELPPGRLQDEE
ncbi:MAG: magnetochrome domain-containing protein [Magnetococcales bacterium]|nr:magnetochrome domain-containing protein [Magnetococcales bacterium]